MKTNLIKSEAFSKDIERAMMTIDITKDSFDIYQICLEFKDSEVVMNKVYNNIQRLSESRVMNLETLNLLSFSRFKKLSGLASKLWMEKAEESDEILRLHKKGHALFLISEKFTETRDTTTLSEFTRDMNEFLESTFTKECFASSERQKEIKKNLKEFILKDRRKIKFNDFNKYLDCLFNVVLKHYQAE